MSLANQGCKGALASKKPYLTKRPKPKPRIQLTLNSAIKMPPPQAKKTVQAINRRTVAKSVAFCSFVPLQRKTQCLRQNLVAKVLWHIKSHDLPKATSQSSRIQLALNSETDCGSTGENAYQGGNWHTVPEFGFAEFWSFGTGRLHKAGRFRCQNGLPRRADEAEAVVADPEAGVVELPVRDGTA